MKNNEKFDFQIKWHTFILLKSLKDTGFIKVCSFVITEKLHNSRNLRAKQQKLKNKSRFN